MRRSKRPERPARPRPGHDSDRGAITDGTSNTFLYAEGVEAHPERNNNARWWTGGNYGTGMFTSLFPINSYKKKKEVGYNHGSSNWYISPSSRHPGGANATFADGSVKFMKDTIESWSNGEDGNGFPLGVTLPGSQPNLPTTPSIAAGIRLGVFQALSTRAGGEVVSADQY